MILSGDPKANRIRSCWGYQSQTFSSPWEMIDGDIFQFLYELQFPEWNCRFLNEPRWRYLPIVSCWIFLLALCSPKSTSTPCTSTFPHSQPRGKSPFFLHKACYECPYFFGGVLERCFSQRVYLGSGHFLRAKKATAPAVLNRTFDNIRGARI